MLTRVHNLSLCIIDDCEGRDLPLVDISVQGLEVRTKRAAEPTAALTSLGTGTFAGSYYNTVVSAWEPFLEPWRAQIQWQRGSAPAHALTVLVSADARLELNLTPSLLQSITNSATNWKDDYQRHQPLPVSGF